MKTNKWRVACSLKMWNLYFKVLIFRPQKPLFYLNKVTLQVKQILKTVVT